MSIRCMWAEENKFVVNPDGQIWPCCYLCNLGLVLEYRDQYSHRLSYIYDEYFKYKDELNLKNNDLETILNHKWFNEILPNSWKNEELTHSVCKRFCKED